MFDYQMVTLEFVGDTTKNQDFVGLSETRMPPAPHGLPSYSLLTWQMLGYIPPSSKKPEFCMSIFP